jgi:hypothetical protein
VEEVTNQPRIRAMMGAIGAGLTAYGNALATPPTPYGAQRAGSCSSDFDCNYGDGCVKSPGLMTGTCMQKVNDFGTPTFAPPSTRSFQPGERSCSFSTQCAPGFRCDEGNCVR